MSTHVEVLTRRERVAEMYLKGHTRDSIARELGVANGAVSEDLAAVRAEWAERCSVRLAELREEELAKLRLLEAACWARFAATGNASHARNILKAVELRCKLLGLLTEQAAHQPLPALSWGEIAGVVGRAEVDMIEKRIAQAGGVSGT